MRYSDQESSTLEFKREIPKSDQIIKTIIGFCNQKGGKLVIGVDNDGIIVGVDEDEVQAMMEYIEKTIIESSFPPILTHVYMQRMNDAILVFIEVTEGMNKPYYLKSAGRDTGTYVRLGRSTVLATPDMIEELKLDVHAKFFDATPVYQAREEDLDTEKIENFLVTRKSAKKPSTEKTSLLDAMLAYQIIVKDQGRVYPTVCGLLLFGKKPQFFFTEARIMSNQFPTYAIGRDVLASAEGLGTIDEQFYTILDFILSRLTRSWKIIGPKRHEQLEIPEKAIREVLINALVHRNYRMPAPIKVAIFSDRIEIFSPGVFPGPVEQNLRAGFTYLRNPTICKILREMQVIENFGLGFITLFESYEQAGLKVPEVIEGAGFIKCILPRNTPENVIQKARTPSLDGDELAPTTSWHQNRSTTAMRRLIEWIAKGTRFIKNAWK